MFLLRLRKKAGKTTKESSGKNMKKIHLAGKPKANLNSERQKCSLSD
jgi:hypothetical protein